MNKRRLSSAQILLVLLIESPYAVAQSSRVDEKELHEIEKQADRRDADAQLSLASEYQVSTKIPNNEAEAVKWYSHAAEQGNMKAEFNIGTMIHRGIGVQGDSTKALKRNKRAAEQGVAISQYNVRVMYAKGQGEQVASVDSAEGSPLNEHDIKALCAKVARNVTMKDNLYKDKVTGETRTWGYCDESTDTRCMVSRQLMRKRVRTVTDLTALSKTYLTARGSRQYFVGPSLFNIWTNVSLAKLPADIGTYKKGQPVIVSGTIRDVRLFEPPPKFDDAEHGCVLIVEDAALESDGF